MPPVGNEVLTVAEVGPVQGGSAPSADPQRRAIANKTPRAQANIDVAVTERGRSAMPFNPPIVRLIPEDLPPAIQLVFLPILLCHRRRSFFGFALDVTGLAP